MSRFLNPNYATLAVYQPGEQPQDKQYIKLNTNESPFAPSKGVLAAVGERQMADLRLYSDPTCKQLAEGLADLYGVAPEQVYLANGSDDILNFAFAAFGQDGVAYPNISYGFYPVFAKLYGLTSTEIPLKPDFSICAADYHHQNKMIVIANPNAPTGLLLSVEEIEEILKTNPNHVVVIDEAYIDFGGKSCLPLIQQYENLLVVRTYSKSRSMAGARLGFAFGNRALIADLERLKYSTNPYNVNRLTQIAGLAALKEDDYYRQNSLVIQQNRAFAAKALAELGFVMTDSKANFLFVKSSRIAGKDLYLKLKEKGVLVRHFDTPALTDYNRITVGTKQQMQRLVEVTAEILEESK